MKFNLCFSFFAIISLCMAISKSDFAFLGMTAGIIHESGHLFSYILRGFPPKEIYFEYSGIRLIPFKRVFSVKDEIFFLISGSALNFIFFVLFYGKLWGFIHLVSGVFNLLPLKSLDGGQILEAIMQKLFGVHKGSYISETVSLITLIFLIVTGIILFYKTGNFTLLLTVIHLLLLGFFAK